MAELQNTLTRREKTVKTVSQDLLKANDIIRKLQAETKAHHAKVGHVAFNIHVRLTRHLGPVKPVHPF